MADLFLLSQAQMRRIERYFPLSHGVARGGRPADRQRHRLCDLERDACRHAGETMARRRRSTIGLSAPAACACSTRQSPNWRATAKRAERITIDATHLKAYRTAASLLKKGLFPDVSGAPKAA